MGLLLKAGSKGVWGLGSWLKGLGVWGFRGSGCRGLGI